MADFPELMTRDLPEGCTLVDGGVTAAPGYRAGATVCGIKSYDNTPDLAVLVADTPCTTVATWTTSRTPAHPVRLDQQHLAQTHNRAQVVVVNSGNANCANGEQGMRDAEAMAQLVAEKFGVNTDLALVSSTGIIGRRLPMEKVEKGIAQVEVTSGPEAGHKFAQAILTTDTREKTVAVQFQVGGKTVRLGGSTKGAGMIYPNMATMLCYLTTDAALDTDWAQQTLRAAVRDSFNMICVDGDMSTNDTVLLFANGQAGNAPVGAGTSDAAAFERALRYVTRYLAREIARDGEGATKLMTVTVSGAASEEDARAAARAITASPLWQCAVAGGDPNWGRIIAALGASGAKLDESGLSVTLGNVQLVRGGVGADYDQAQAKAAMAGSEIQIAVDLHQGNASATAWGCDLTHGYIDENTTYTR